MDIIYVFDDNFSVCAAVSMISVLENNMEVDNIHFHIFDDGISNDSKSKLQQICTSYNAKITFLDVQPVCGQLEKLGVQPWRGRYSAYVKLMIAGFLPPEIERAIVIDADTVVTGSILDLQTMDLHGHPCAMALEGIPGDYQAIAGIGRSELYNTGVIVYDMSVWREKLVEERLIYHLTNVRSRYMLPEEDPISIILKGDVQRLAPKFNYIVNFYFYGNERYFERFGWDILGEKFYTIEDFETSRGDIRIYHCTDAFTGRPWFRNNVHPYTQYYDRYLSMTPWKDVEKREQSFIGVTKVEYFLRKHLPKTISDYMYYIACKLFYTVKAKRFYGK